jgi:hypothetical protein
VPQAAAAEYVQQPAAPRRRAALKRHGTGAARPAVGRRARQARAPELDIHEQLQLRRAQRAQDAADEEELSIEDQLIAGQTYKATEQAYQDGLDRVCRRVLRRQDAQSDSSLSPPPDDLN